HPQTGCAPTGNGLVTDATQTFTEDPTFVQRGLGDVLIAWETALFGLAKCSLPSSIPPLGKKALNCRTTAGVFCFDVGKSYGGCLSGNGQRREPGNDPSGRLSLVGVRCSAGAGQLF